MIKYQDSIREKVEELLNNNSYGILFDVSLYNSKKIKYEKSFDTDNYGVEIKRIVPTNIVSISGDFINIPETNVLNALIEIDFDIFVGNYLDMSFELQETFKSVDYNNTMNAIKEFKRQLLAKYIPLGDVGLMMGGEDSNLTYNIGSEIPSRLLYLKFEAYNNDQENLITLDESLLNNYMKITKESTELRFYYTQVDYLVLPYTIKEEKSIVAYYNGIRFVFEDSLGNRAESAKMDFIAYTTETLKIAETTGYEGIIKEFGLSSTTVSQFDFNNIELADFVVLVTEFENRYFVSDENNVINNSILWGSNGNAVFGFKELVPIGDIRPTQEFHYQEFGLDLPSIISGDVLFGNLFEYFIDGEQVFPVDRSHTWGGDSSSEQKVNQEYATEIGEVSQKDITKTFFYKPSKKLTKLMKQITSNGAKQNEPYELVVQYPFYKETYDVRVNQGGTNPNINDLSTFTITFKQRDTTLD